MIGAAELKTARPGATVVVAGLVTHRQQPGTARGVVFLSLEDETGMANVICPPPVWERHRRLAMDASALLVQGRVERLEGAVSLLATRLRRLPVVAASPQPRLPLSRSSRPPGHGPVDPPPRAGSGLRLAALPRVQFRPHGLADRGLADPPLVGQGLEEHEPEA